jgi:hypothetical protein
MVPTRHANTINSQILCWFRWVADTHPIDSAVAPVRKQTRISTWRVEKVLLDYLAVKAL